jgi:cell division protein FtsB
MIKKTPKLSKPDYKYSNYKGHPYTSSSLKRGLSRLQVNASNEAKSAVSIARLSDDVSELKDCIENLVNLVEELNDEISCLHEYSNSLEEWGDEWVEVAEYIDTYAIYPFTTPLIHAHFVVPAESIQSHNLCSYTSIIELYNETGLTFGGFDHSSGAIFNITNEKKWMLCKIKHGY